MLDIEGRDLDVNHFSQVLKSPFGVVGFVTLVTLRGLIQSAIIIIVT